MTKKSYNEDHDYYDFDDDELRGDRRNKKEKDLDKKKQWDRESLYDSDHDYDERR